MCNETRNNVTKEEIENIVKKLQWLLTKMESKKINSIEADGTTYLTDSYINIAGIGYIKLDNLEYYIDEPNEDCEVE